MAPASPGTPPGPLVDEGPTQLLANANGQHALYSGVGRVNGSSTCTGFFIKTVEGAAASTAPAYVLTSGNCALAWDSNDVIIERLDNSMQVTFGYFFDTPRQQNTVKVKRVAYATMKGTDLAVLELDTTYAALLAQGIQPLTIFQGQPRLNEPIAVVGIPAQDIPASEAYLRIAACTLGAQVNLIEGHWHFFDAYRNRCADIRGGSAGSPVIAREHGEVLALITTTTAGSAFGDCSFHRPCEIELGGYHVVLNTNYAAGVQGIDRCFDANGLFSLELPDCALDKGQQFAVSGYPLSATRPAVPDSSGLLRRVSWNATLSGDTYTYYRYKIGAAAQTDCRDPLGYGSVLNVNSANLIDAPVPEVEGRYVLCILGGNSPEVDANWQAPRFATIIPLQIDMTPPLREPRLYAEQLDGSYRVSFQYILPELARYKLKVGAPAQTDCNDLRGYATPRASLLTLPIADGPYTVCAIGYDDADNPSHPVSLALN